MLNAYLGIGVVIACTILTQRIWTKEEFEDQPVTLSVILVGVLLFVLITLFWLPKLLIYLWETHW